MPKIIQLVQAFDPTMFEGIPVTIQAGVSLLFFGGWAGLFWMVRLMFTGKLCSGRELQEKNARIEILEDTIRVRDEQLSKLLAIVPGVADVLHKFHLAAKSDKPASDETEHVE